jgi:Immunoglobulin I-set domain/Fibronectin type III domain
MRAAIILERGRKSPAVLIGFILSCLLLCASSTRGQSVSLTWNPGPSGTTAGYYLYYGTNISSYSARIDVGTNTVATLTGLTIGQTYYFVVTAYNSARIESLPSNQASFVVPNTSSSLAPQLAAVSPSSATPGAQVFIYGANFTTATSVQFSGVNAPFDVSSPGVLIATVPAGAASGPLAITTSQGVISIHFVVVPATPPANDNFNNARILTGTAAIVSTNTMGATKQPGEPNHAGNAGGSSVWYRWTAPSAGTWSLDTTGSAFTTLLAVYTGNALTSLSPVASNLISPGVFASSLNFTAVAGITYQIAVDGLGGAAGNLVLHVAPAAAASTTTVYSTSFETSSGFYSSGSLAGQSGWLASGTASSGLKVNAFPGYGQQAYIGFLSSIPANSTLLYVPLNYTVNTNSSPLIQFSVIMQLSAPVASFYNGVFGWVVRNASGQELFRVSFDDYSKAVSYALNNGSGPSYPGLSFNNSTVYTLAIAMDLSQNSWSASLNGTPIATGQPITTTGAALTLGDIDASEVFPVASSPGTDGMLFDNYLITAGPSLAPKILLGPQNQTISAGNNAFLGALASGAPPLSYQWYTGGNPISNATNSSLFLTGLTAGQAGNYSLVVTNLYGSASTAATLTVTNPPPRSLFAAPVSLGGGGALLSLNVAAGNNYQFQASTNLHDWVTLGSFFAMSTNALCFDAAAAGLPCRFYRLVSP